jgi:hypothetical protein
MRSGTLCANRNWQPVTICNRHDLCSLAAFRFSDLAPTFFSGRETRVDKCFTDIDGASDTELMRKGSHDPRHHAEPNPLLKSPMTGNGTRGIGRVGRPKVRQSVRPTECRSARSGGFSKVALGHHVVSWA